MPSSALFHTAAENAAFNLRTLFERFGYTPYRVGKFEEYDLYARNRSFITGSGILTFTNTDGRLMALKPDVTLSIIKNLNATDALHKVYYNESVYRAANSTDGFREIQQMGLECIGSLNLGAVSEVTALAARSLGAISDEFILDVSHVGLLAGFLEDAGVPEAYRGEFLRLAAEKNVHDTERLCDEIALAERHRDSLRHLITMRGALVPAIEDICGLDLGPAASGAVGELAQVAHVLKNEDFMARVFLDLSLQSDPGYYNGIVLKGYINGVHSPVLSGGRYDGLVRKLGKRCGAMGFAVYLNLLERWGEDTELESDVLLLDDGTASAEDVYDMARRLRDGGESVRVDRHVPEDIRFRRVIRVGKKGED